MKTYTIRELFENPPNRGDTHYVLESEAMEFRAGTIHNFWQTASREKLIEALQFQGAITKELLKETEELRAELEKFKNVPDPIIAHRRTRKC